MNILTTIRHAIQELQSAYRVAQRVDDRGEFNGRVAAETDLLLARKLIDDAIRKLRREQGNSATATTGIRTTERHRCMGCGHFDNEEAWDGPCSHYGGQPGRDGMCHFWLPVDARGVALKREACTDYAVPDEDAVSRSGWDAAIDRALEIIEWEHYPREMHQRIAALRLADCHQSQPGDPTVRHVVAWMRATYPQNKHAREWAAEIERVFLGGPPPRGVDEGITEYERGFSDGRQYTALHKTEAGNPK